MIDLLPVAFLSTFDFLDMKKVTGWQVMSGFVCSIILVEVAANGPAYLEQIIKQK